MHDVGPGNSRTLLLLPELGTISRVQVVALVGSAPFNRESGKAKGQRANWGGRTSGRPLLYMASVTAMGGNPVIRAFHDRLRAAGKPYKLA